MHKMFAIIVYIFSFIFKIVIKMLSKLRLISKPLVGLSNNRYYQTDPKSSVITKRDVKNILLNAKDQSNLTFDEMAHQLNKNKVIIVIYPMLQRYKNNQL